tara:strand:- start:1228 stop:1707 length:480 start_codon:yes stop_codon:yes gene_type:complete
VRIRLGLARRREAPVIALMSRDLVEHGIPSSWNEDRILNCLVDSSFVVVVARHIRQVAGFAIAEFTYNKIHLDLLAVSQGYQRQGIGRQLIEWLESSAKTSGRKIMSLEVRASNTGAMGFYNRLGFYEESVKHDYYAGKDDAICLHRRLNSGLASIDSC